MPRATRRLSKDLLRCALLATAEQAYITKPLPPQVSAARKHGARDARILLDHTSPVAPGARSPLQWGREESFLRTGLWCSAGLPGGLACGWRPSALGGNHVKRALGEYLADHNSQGTVQVCTKHKEARRGLLPGLLLGWCMDCRVCVFMSVMANCESPRSPFEVFRCMIEVPPSMVVYDNCCNLMQYILNREPAAFKSTEFLVDAMHYTEHKHCGLDFDSSKYAAVTNSPLAEQKNYVMRQLDHSASFMNQDTFMFFVRHWLHRMRADTRER